MNELIAIAVFVVGLVWGYLAGVKDGRWIERTLHGWDDDDE